MAVGSWKCTRHTQGETAQGSSHTFVIAYVKERAACKYSEGEKGGEAGKECEGRKEGASP